MPHIHTAPGQHDHTASAYVFRTDFSEPKVLLHLHKKLGKYMQFGGHIELHETPWQAITHELLEESGYVMDQLRILQPPTRIEALTGVVVHPQPVVHSTQSLENHTHFHIDSIYAFITTEQPRYSPDEGETSDTMLITKDELASLPDAKILPNVREIGLHIFDYCLYDWQAVTPSSFK